MIHIKIDTGCYVRLLGRLIDQNIKYFRISQPPLTPDLPIILSMSTLKNQIILDIEIRRSFGLVVLFTLVFKCK